MSAHASLLLATFLAFWHSHCALCVGLTLLVVLGLTTLVIGIVLIVRSVLRKRSTRHFSPRELLLPTLLSQRVPPQAATPFTLSALLAPTALLATAPVTVRIGLKSNGLPSSSARLARQSLDFACCGLARPASWGRATFNFFGARISSSFYSTSSSLDDKALNALEVGELPSTVDKTLPVAPEPGKTFNTPEPVKRFRVPQPAKILNTREQSNTSSPTPEAASIPPPTSKRISWNRLWGVPTVRSSKPVSPVHELDDDEDTPEDDCDSSTLARSSPRLDIDNLDEDAATLAPTSPRFEDDVIKDDPTMKAAIVTTDEPKSPPPSHPRHRASTRQPRSTETHTSLLAPTPLPASHPPPSTP